MYVPVATSIENYLPRRGEMISNVCDYLVTVLYHGSTHTLFFKGRKATY
jgi:hypothetical protein